MFYCRRVGEHLWSRGWIGLMAAFLFLPLGAQTVALPKNARAGWFRVDARDPSLAVWHVTAGLRATRGKIFTGAGGDAGYLEHRWVGQVEDLQVNTPQGQRVTTLLQKDSEDFYRFWALSLNGEPYLGPVQLKYKLNLNYTRDKHPYGNEQGGQAFDEAVYTVAKPLFVASDVPGTWGVEFQIPSGWRVATPLGPVNSKEWVFQAESLDALHVNPLVIGRFGEVRSTIGDFEFILVLPGEFTQFASDIEPVVTPVLALYQRLFPGTPAGREMEPFFQRYVSTRNPVDVAAIFSRFGLIANQKPYAGELILVRAENAGPERRAAWKGLIRHRFDHLKM